MRSIAFFCYLAFTCLVSHAQSCDGGLYLNPQVIRGEGTAQTYSALKELVEFVRPTGLSVATVLNIKETGDVLAAVKKPSPPCWIYGNPTVGLASGYVPAAVNTSSIEAAVLIIADVGKTKDGKAVDLKDLSANDQASVLAKLKATTCFGMKSGVTTALVQSEKLCGTVTEILPQQGLGQSYLPTKAAFHWKPDQWAGLITRVQSARSATMKTHFGSDALIHMAQLVVVPASNASWGYGIYIHPDVPTEVIKKAIAQFTSLKSANPSQALSLDLGSKFEFATPSEAAVKAMRRTLTATP